MRTPIFMVALAYPGGVALFADVDDSPRFLLLLALAALALGAVFWTCGKERAARSLVSSVVRTGLRAWDFSLISFAIHLGFVLLTALYFHHVFWAGLLANRVVVPLVGIIVPLGLAGSALPAKNSWQQSVRRWRWYPSARAIRMSTRERKCWSGWQRPPGACIAPTATDASPCDSPARNSAPPAPAGVSGLALTRISGPSCWFARAELRG